MSRRNGSPNYVEFPFDREVTVTLAEDRGRLSQNDYGEYFLRKFDDGRFTCANPDLERRILDSGARRGSAVSITKEKYGRSAVWVVKLMGSNMKPDPVKVQPIKANGHTNGHSSNAWDDLPHSPIPESKYTPAPADAQLEEKLRESIAAVEAEKTAPLVQPNQTSSLLTTCAIAAIEAAQAAEAYAVAHGFPLKFREDQIQAWASTLYIQSAKQSNINLMHRNETLRAESR
jgi:hypothetical protein